MTNFFFVKCKTDFLYFVLLLHLNGHLSLAPLVALVTRDCEQSWTELVVGASVDIKSSDGGPVHVVPEGQALTIGGGVLGTE